MLSIHPAATVWTGELHSSCILASREPSSRKQGAVVARTPQTPPRRQTVFFSAPLGLGGRLDRVREFRWIDLGGGLQTLAADVVDANQRAGVTRDLDVADVGALNVSQGDTFGTGTSYIH